MTILKNYISEMKKENIDFVGSSSVWNVHNVKIEKTAIQKNTNLNTDLKKFFKAGKLEKGVTIFVGAKGRSQHSKSELLIFNGISEDLRVITFDYSELVNIFGDVS